MKIYLTVNCRERQSGAHQTICSVGGDTSDHIRGIDVLEIRFYFLVAEIGVDPLLQIQANVTKHWVSTRI